MISPKTPEQLAHAIDVLVASYLDETRRATQVAVERLFARTGAGRASNVARRGRAEALKSRKRRSGGEIADVQERLYELICARPGESISVFAEEAGLPVSAVRRPMSKLLADGRIRCVGNRGTARYFPAVSRRSKTADV